MDIQHRKSIYLYFIRLTSRWPAPARLRGRIERKIVWADGQISAARGVIWTSGDPNDFSRSLGTTRSPALCSYEPYLCAFKALITYVPIRQFSTPVERALQINPLLCKTNPIFRYFSLIMKVSLKNKPNSNPIQTQSKPILSQKSGWQIQTNPIQTQLKNQKWI